MQARSNNKDNDRNSHLDSKLAKYGRSMSRSRSRSPSRTKVRKHADLKSKSPRSRSPISGPRFNHDHPKEMKYETTTFSPRNRNRHRSDKVLDHSIHDLYQVTLTNYGTDPMNNTIAIKTAIIAAESKEKAQRHAEYEIFKSAEEDHKTGGFWVWKDKVDKCTKVYDPFYEDQDGDDDQSKENWNNWSFIRSHSCYQLSLKSIRIESLLESKIGNFNHYQTVDTR